MKTLYTNISGLFVGQSNPSPLTGEQLGMSNILADVYILVENDRIIHYGPMSESLPNVDRVKDLTGKWVLPTFCDSHTHLVFAKTRENEFEQRIAGASYEEIAQAGGGIQNSALALQEMDEELLFEKALIRLKEAEYHGTGAIEIKSGYGLTLDAELKMLRVIQRLKETTNIPVKATFLGAHTVPTEYKNSRQDYINLIIHEMLPRIQDEGLADYMDVFCEKVAFSVYETKQLLEAGHRFGLKPKVHTNQFNSMGGIQACVDAAAISVDHLEVINDEEIHYLQNSGTIATLLPTAPFFLNDPLPEARKMIAADLPIALATDFNPGSSPSLKMPFVISLACIKMKMTAIEAINAATIQGAFALEIQDQVGSIQVGKKANFIITEPMEHLSFIPYSFGHDWIDQVVLNGQEIR